MRLIKLIGVLLTILTMNTYSTFCQMIIVNSPYSLYPIQNPPYYQSISNSEINMLKNDNKIQIRSKVDNGFCTSCIGVSCDEFNDVNIITLTPQKKLRLQADKFMSDEIKMTNQTHLYGTQFDSTLIGDTLINTIICIDSIFCSVYNKQWNNRYYLDEDSNYHFIGFIGMNECQGTSPYRVIYLKVAKENVQISASYPYFSNQTIIKPGSFIHYKILDTYKYLQNNYTDYRSQISITSTADHQSLLLFAKDSFYYNYNVWENSYSNFYAVKIDKDNNITYARNIFKEFETDSTYIISGGNDFYRDSNGIYAIGGAQANTMFTRIQQFYYKINFTPIGEFISVDTFSSYDTYDSLISSFNYHKKNYVYRQNTLDSTTTIKYFNRQGDTIKTVVLPVLFNHEPSMSNDRKYIKVDLSTNGYDYQTRFIYELFDSTGHRINHFEKPAYESSYWEYLSSKQYKYFVETDSFDNIFFTYTKFKESCAACGPGISNYQCYVFNKDIFYQVSGAITYDNNSNCMTDSGEAPVKNILVELILNNKHYYTTTNDLGYYSIYPYDTGHGKLIVHLEQQRFFINACTDTFDVFISDTTINPFVDVLLQANPCKLPKVSVNISTPFLLRCFDNVYTLSLTNEIADTIAFAYADVTLDDDLIPIDTAFNTATSLGNNTYRFYFQDLLPFQTIRKALTVNVNCSTTILGQAHCVQVVASPYNNCVTFDFPRLSALSQCRNDSVLFTISRNVLPDNYNVNYRIITDDSVSNTGTLNFTSTVNTHQLVFANPLGKTLRFESYQIPAYPNEDTIVSISIEGCGNDTFSIGYLNLFPPDDDVPFIDIDCQQNVGSFDPNEKAAQPNGYGDSAYILPNTALEYTIHFQNKGTFNAYMVSISDTLSSYLDIRTFEFIASSHEFTYSIIDSNVLVFTSVNIILPAEQDDSLGSMGFIKFRIAPKENSHNGTIINNKASIVFDYNEAIITNTVSRNINDGFIKVNLISSIRNNTANIKSSVYPNPFNQTATLTFDYAKPTQLRIFSLDGRLVQSYQSSTNLYLIDRKSLGNGLYLYELLNLQNELLDYGKLIIQ